MLIDTSLEKRYHAEKRKVLSMKLKQLRKERKLTQAQLAELSGVNSRQIQRIENGEGEIGNMTLKNALALAKALNVEVAELID